VVHFQQATEKLGRIHRVFPPISYQETFHEAYGSRHADDYEAIQLLPDRRPQHHNRELHPDSKDLPNSIQGVGPGYANNISRRV